MKQYSDDLKCLARALVFGLVLMLTVNFGVTRFTPHASIVSASQPGHSIPGYIDNDDYLY